MATPRSTTVVKQGIDGQEAVEGAGGREAGRRLMPNEGGRNGEGDDVGGGGCAAGLRMFMRQKSRSSRCSVGRMFANLYAWTMHTRAHSLR